MDTPAVRLKFPVRLAIVGLIMAALLLVSLPARAEAAGDYELRAYGTKCVSGQTDERRYLYVVCHDERLEGYLRVVAPDGRIVQTVRVPGANDVAPAPDGSYVYVSGGGNYPLRRYDRRADGSYEQNYAYKAPTFPLWGKDYPAKGRQIATDAFGNLYVANGVWTDELLHVVVKFGPDGRYITQFGGFTNTWKVGEFYSLSGIAVSRDGRHIYTTELHNSRVQRFDQRADGSYDVGRVWGNTAITDPFRLGMCAPSMLAAPYDIAVDGWGDVWVTSTSCTYVQKFSKDGGFLFASFVGNRGALQPGVLADRNQNSHNLAIDGNGNVISGETSSWLVRTGNAPAWPPVGAVPAPEPAPAPAPAPDPDPIPGPGPAPDPEPAPAPAPAPAPGPDRSAPIVRDVTVPATSRSRDIVVMIDAIDDRAVTQVRMATDNGNDWTAWQAITAQPRFTLREGIGYRGVYVHVRDAAGNESNIVYRRTHVLAQEAPAPAPQPAPAPAPQPEPQPDPAPAPDPDPAPAPVPGPDRSSPVVRDVTVPATTTTQQITVTIDAIDDNAVTHVRMATENGDDWTAWQPYTARMQFVLRAGFGYRGVYVHVRDAAGNESNIVYRRTHLLAG